MVSHIPDEQLSRLRSTLARYRNNRCFVASPIGKPGSPIRKRADSILRHIIQPAAAACGLEAIRADNISEAGIITHQVIEHLIVDQMVVADLTGHNANVFYELAVRHAIRRPYIQIIQKGQPLPFDIASVRTIEVDHRDLDDVDRVKVAITKMMSAFKEEEEVDSPISAGIGHFLLRDINRFLQGNEQLYEILKDIRDAIGFPYPSDRAPSE